MSNNDRGRRGHGGRKGPPGDSNVNNNNNNNSNSNNSRYNNKNKKYNEQNNNNNSNTYKNTNQTNQQNNNYNNHQPYRGQSNNRSNNNNEDNRKALATLQHMMRANNIFKNQHDMRRLVLQAAQVGEVDEVVHLFGDENGVGVQKISQIIQNKYNVDVGDRPHPVSFQKVILPLISLVTSTRFAASPHREELRRVYNAFYAYDSFMKDVLECVEILTERRSITDMGPKNATPHQTDGEAWTPPNWVQVLDPIASLLTAIFTRITDAQTDDRFGAWFAMLAHYFDTWSNHQDCPGSEQLKDMINRGNSLATKQEQKIITQFGKLTLADKSNRRRTTVRAEEVGPGNFRPEGPRHDNDFEDFRKILVIPTKQEIFCDVAPYLPNTSSTNSYLPDGVDRYLDRQFRLMREDSMVAVQKGISSFALNGGLKGLGKKQVFRTVGNDSVDLLVFRNVNVIGITASIWRGVCIVLSFAQPQRAQALGKQELIRYWDIGGGSRQLQQGSLVSIWLNASNASTEKQMYFGIVSDRKNVARSQVEIRLLEYEHLLELSATLKAGYKSKGENILMQVRGHFFAATEPVLKALQMHTETTLPFVDCLAYGKSTLRPPAYITTGSTKFDLSHLIKSDIPEMQKQTALKYLKSVDMGDYNYLRQVLEYLEGSIILDSTQADALAATLSREVALIQGPPGTGKTYIGVHIVNILLKNSIGLKAKKTRYPNLDPHTSPTGKNVLTPILAICYTNHALDQFLEGIVKQGLPLEEVIRVGGRSKSELLAGQNLRDLSYGTLTPQEKHRRYELMEKAKSQEASIRKYSDLKHKKILDYNDVEPLLQALYPNHLDEIQGSSEKYAAPHMFVLAKTPKEVFDIWKTGTDIPNVENTLHVVRMVVEDMYQISLWELNMAERKLLYDRWCEVILEDKEHSFKTDCAKYERTQEKLKGEETACHLRVLRNASVVGFTTSGAASHQDLFRSLAPRIVICEEAGEVFESHLLTSLTQQTQHLIMIGDHQQLRPKVEEHKLSVDSRNGYDLDLSLFERLVTARETEYGKNALSTGSLVTLTTQRRMRPEISNLIRVPIYPALLDSDAVLNYPDVKGMAENLWFFDHYHQENGGEEGEARSYVNLFEAQLVVVLVRHLVRQGYKPDQIAVLTPYAGQLLKLRELLMNSKMAIYIDERTLADIAKTNEGEDLEGDEGSDSDDERDIMKENLPAKSINKKIEYVKNVKVKDCVRLATVDNFQGEEADVVLISTVRCNNRGSTGFLKISNRVNVMMSRAKHGMYVFGSAETISSCSRATVFNSMLEDFQEHKRIGGYLPLKCSRHTTQYQIKTPEEFERLVPDGGCSIACGTRLLCGHACPRMCHPDDVNHLGTKCNERCVRLHTACEHPCVKLCHQTCGNCNVKVSFLLPCGHMAKSVSCYLTLTPEHIECDYPMEVKYPLCAHKCMTTCSKRAALRERIRQLQADATQLSNDSKDPIFGCTERCNSVLLCTHSCMQPCGKCCAKTVSDQKSITLTLVNKTQHNISCSTVCKRALLCGHSCTGVCHGSTECPPCTLKCPVTCPHTSCGRPCADPCPSCALPCTWKCVHVGECPLPCGSPCVRLPCDVRCNKLLLCGHPCPSICGETCPPVNVGCKICAPANKLSTVVDFVEMTTLEQHDADKDPLIAIGCGHIFSLSTLDGVVGLENAYAKDKNGKWCSVLPLPQKCGAVPQCPHCRAPIANIRRYGRILTHLSLEQASIKFRLKIDRESHAIKKELLDISKSLDGFEELGITKDSAAKFTKLQQEIEGNCTLVEHLCKTVEKEQPELRVYEKAAVALNNSSSTIPLPPYIPPSPQASIAATGTLAQVFLFRFRMLVIEYHHILKNHGLETNYLKPTHQPKARKGKNAKPPPVAVSDSLPDAAAEFFKKLEHVALYLINRYEELLQVCRTSHSNRSLVEVLQRAIEALYIITANTRKVVYARRFPGVVASATEIAKARVELMAKLLDELATIAPSETANSKALLSSIEKLIRSEFYEEVTKEEKQQIFNAMSGDIGSGVGSFGGHWYTCPNGHVYTIGECGGAMEQSRCPECRTAVGGANHQVTTGNRVAVDFLASINQLQPGHRNYRH